MNFKERVYSILVVSAGEQFNRGLTELLPPGEYDPLHFVGSVSEAERALADRRYDFVMVNSPLPDGTGVSFAIDVSATPNAVCLLLLRPEQYNEIYNEVTAQGVYTLIKPVPKRLIDTGMRWMAASRERLRQFEKRTLTLEEKMAEIRLVNRAKWHLIDTLGLTEDAAHHYIERLAMDLCISKREAAEQVLSQ